MIVMSLNTSTASPSSLQVYTGYAFLQGLVLFLLMLRLINYVSFQPRLSIISGTMARMLPDMAHFAVIFAVVAAMFAMMVTLVFGYRCALRTYSRAL